MSKSKNKPQSKMNDTQRAFYEMINDPMFYACFLVIIGLILVLMIWSTSPSINTPEYDSDTGIIVDKYKIYHTSFLSKAGGYLYYLDVDCNGINRTVTYYSGDQGAWCLNEIGDEKTVVFPK